MLSRSRLVLLAAPDRHASSGVGPKIVRGIVYGGLAGGLCGLAIEMTPEQYGLKKRSHAWFEAGKCRFEALFGLGSGATSSERPIAVKPLAPSKGDIKTPVTESHADKPAPPKPIEPLKKMQDPVPSDASPIWISNDKKEEVLAPVKSCEEEEFNDVSTSAEGEEEQAVDITTIPESADIIGESDEAGVSESAIVEDIRESEEVHPNEQESERKPQEDATVLVQSEIANLRAELSRVRQEHNEELAKAAGATQASLDTLDRLFNERETAVSVAKHGLLVNEVLYALALDKSSTSAGALRVDLERRMGDLIADCFTPPQEEATFFKLVFGRLLAWFYNPRAGGFLTTICMHGSPTWENLCAVEVARSAVDRGDFCSAVIHLEMLEHSETAKEWISKAKQAQRLWQGAEAAVASMHDDLSKVVLS